MQREPRHSILIHSITLCLLLGCSAASVKKSQQDIKREKDFNFKILESSEGHHELPGWVRGILHKSSGKKLGVHLYESSKSEILYVVESGIKTTQELACTLSRAKGRELIVESLILSLSSKVGNPSWLSTLKREGGPLFNKILSQNLSKESIKGEFWERRLYPSRNEKGESERLTDCFILVSIPKGELQRGLDQLKTRIKEEYLHQLSIDFELSRLILP